MLILITFVMSFLLVVLDNRGITTSAAAERPQPGSPITLSPRMEAAARSLRIGRSAEAAHETSIVTRAVSMVEVASPAETAVSTGMAAARAAGVGSEAREATSGEVVLREAETLRAELERAAQPEEPPAAVLAVPQVVAVPQPVRVARRTHEVE